MSTGPARNEPCPCGSGKKFKHCCLKLDHANAPALRRPSLEEGLQHHRIGQLERAEHIYRALLREHPQHADALHLLGLVCQQTGRLAEARDRIQAALLIQPNTAPFLNSLGTTLKLQGQPADAAQAFREATQVDPGYAEAWNNLGNLFHEQGQYATSAAALQRATQLNPQSAAAWFNLGRAQHSLGHTEDAVASLRRSLVLQPGQPQALVDLGVVHQQMGDYGPARACYERALAAAPQFAEAHWNLGLLDLLHGDYARGWIGYEWRWRTLDGKYPQRRFQRPVWRGEAIHDLLLVHAEQGFGDTILAARYLKLLEAQGMSLVIEVQPELVSLLQGSCHSPVVARGQKLPAFGWHCPMMSLPAAFETRLGNIPADLPYLAAPPALITAWQERLPASGTRKRLGLTWRGSLSLEHDRRSLSLKDLAPLWGLPDIDWVVLQLDMTDQERAALPSHVHVLPQAPTDFADTAAILHHLDGLLTVDTAMANLAGALGSHAWVLVPHAPDWRWGLASSQTPWYPHLRLFRQFKAGSWSQPVANVALALRALTHPDAHPGSPRHLEWGTGAAQGNTQGASEHPHATSDTLDSQTSSA